MTKYSVDGEQIYYRQFLSILGSPQWSTLLPSDVRDEIILAGIAARVDGNELPESPPPDQRVPSRAALCRAKRLFDRFDQFSECPPKGYLSASDLAAAASEAELAASASRNRGSWVS